MAREINKEELEKGKQEAEERKKMSDDPMEDQFKDEELFEMGMDSERYPSDNMDTSEYPRLDHESLASWHQLRDLEQHLHSEGQVPYNAIHEKPKNKRKNRKKKKGK